MTVQEESSEDSRKRKRGAVFFEENRGLGGLPRLLQTFLDKPHKSLPGLPRGLRGGKGGLPPALSGFFEELLGGTSSILPLFSS